MGEFKSTDLAALGNLVKEKAKTQEPVKEGVTRTGEMLISPVAKKVLGYLFEQNQSKVETLLQDPTQIEFINKIKKTLTNKDSLQLEDALKIDNLFIQLLQKIPIANSEKGGSILYKEIATKSGCKIEDVKKLMDAFIVPGLDEWFKKSNKN